MINNLKVLAIIPARGGSKGLPRKNILRFGGLPLIAWTIQAAQQSKYIDRIILSSDDEEICEIAGHYGCEVPFIRPAELADDFADSVLVVSHAIQQVGSDYDVVILLQPTSPFRTFHHIDESLDLFVISNTNSVISVTQLDMCPEWLYWLNRDNLSLSKVLEHQNPILRRQASRPAYYINGAIYIVEKNYFVEHKTFINQKTIAYQMAQKDGLDIDTQDDFDFASYQMGIKKFVNLKCGGEK